MKIKVEYLYNNMTPLKYSHDYDAGADVTLPSDVVLVHGKNVIPLGFKAIIPPGYAGYLCPRSSVMGDGIIYNMTPIDSDYEGEWHMIVYNPGEKKFIEKGSRICQVVIMPVLRAEFVEALNNRRSVNGIGSTGI